MIRFARLMLLFATLSPLVVWVAAAKSPILRLATQDTMIAIGEDPITSRVSFPPGCVLILRTLPESSR
jgi:hypothetical protein